MISKKNSQLLFIIIMAFGMSLIMSGVVTAVNTGVDNGFIGRYFNSFIIALPVGIITAFTINPIARFLVNKIVSK